MIQLWERVAIHDLRRFGTLETAQASLKAQIDNLTGSTDYDSMVTLKIKQLQYERNSADLKYLRQAVENLTDDERTVVDYIYIHPTADHIRKLCRVLSVEQSTIYKIRNRAIEHFCLLYYGI